MHDPPQDDTLMRAECARPPAGDQRKWIRDPVRLAARHGHPLLRARTEDVVAITVRTRSPPIRRLGGRAAPLRFEDGGGGGDARHRATPEDGWILGVLGAQESLPSQSGCQWPGPGKDQEIQEVNSTSMFVPESLSMT